MQFSTTPEIPCKTIQENLGVVTGNVVQSKHVGRDLMAGLKGIIGGEIVGYTEMLADARDIAMWDPLESTCRHASLSIL